MICCLEALESETLAIEVKSLRTRSKLSIFQFKSEGLQTKNIEETTPISQLKQSIKDYESKIPLPFLCSKCFQGFYNAVLLQGLSCPFLSSPTHMLIY